MSKKIFFQAIYEIVAQIPYGKVLTYGQLATLAGSPHASRMTGQAMRNAPKELKLPCHRVVNSQGRLAPGWEEQRQLLSAEKVPFKRNGMVDLSQALWNLSDVKE